MQALEGIRVLDFTQMMLGPFATQMLADLGADVIKVERSDGEWERSLPMMGDYVAGESAAFLAMNRNKRSVAVDLKSPAVRDALLKLGATCDVIVENFRPGVMQRLGLGYDDFKRQRPDIIFCSGTGWGSQSPFATQNRPGQDLLIQAMSGIAASTGRRDDAPTPAGTAIIDHATALTLVSGILAAIIARSRHGIGQVVEVDLYSTAIAMQCQEISAFVNQGEIYTRSAAGVAQAWLSAPYGLYPAADGWIAIAMAPMDALARTLELPGLLSYDPWLERDEAKRLIETRTGAWGADDLVARLLENGLWAAKVRDTREAIDELRSLGSDMLVECDGPDGGQVELVGSPLRLSATPWRQRLSPPRVGEHTLEVFAEVLSSEQLTRIVDSTDD